MFQTTNQCVMDVSFFLECFEWIVSLTDCLYSRIFNGKGSYKFYNGHVNEMFGGKLTREKLRLKFDHGIFSGSLYHGLFPQIGVSQF